MILANCIPGHDVIYHYIYHWVNRNNGWGFLLNYQSVNISDTMNELVISDDLDE